MEEFVRAIKELQNRVLFLEHLERMAPVPRCRVYSKVPIPINSGAWTPLPFDAETFDTDTMHSLLLNPSRITFTNPGTYAVGGVFAFEPNAAGVRYAKIYANGATDIAMVNIPVSTGASDTVLCLSTIYQFTAGQYAELYAYQTSGGARNVSQYGIWSPHFWAFRVW